MANLTLVVDFYLWELSKSEIQAIGGSDQCTPPFNLAPPGLRSFDATCRCFLAEQDMQLPGTDTQ